MNDQTLKHKILLPLQGDTESLQETLHIQLIK